MCPHHLQMIIAAGQRRWQHYRREAAVHHLLLLLQLVQPCLHRRRHAAIPVTMMIYGILLWPTRQRSAFNSAMRDWPPPMAMPTWGMLYMPKPARAPIPIYFAMVTWVVVMAR